MEARLKNIQKARAARKRAPLPWRSAMESRIIEQLVWQWWVESSGEWLVASGEGNQQRIPCLRQAGSSDAGRILARNDSALCQAGGQRNRRVSQNEALRYQGEQQISRSSGQWTGVSGQKKQQQWPAFAEATAGRVSAEGKQQQISRGSGEWLVASGEKSEQQIIALRATGRVNPAPTKAKRPWAKLRVARLLGVSHTWVNKLVKRIEADPERMRRKMRAFAPASFEKLERAREETRRERERGLLRGPIRWRRVKLSLQGRKRKVMVPTKRNKQQIPHTTGMRSVPFDCAQDKRNDNIPLPYREVPEWARGLLLPGDPGITGRVGGRRTPRPVPFAFRRRR